MAEDELTRRKLAESATSVRFMYLQYGKRVRRYLAAFGVGPSELDDLSQEVFLIVMGKGEALAEIDNVRLWLREICRKVAAGERRRGSRKRELPVAHAAETVEDAAPTQAAALEQFQNAEQLQRAMAALDDEDRDLIALHELGGLPIVAVAELLDRDRKTVRKRLDEANRKLSRLFRAQEQESAQASPLVRFSMPTAAGERVHTAPAQFLGRTPDIVVGRVGAVLIAVWPGPPTLEALELLDEHMRATSRELGSGLVYFSVVESTTSTPSLEARKKITSMLKEHSEKFGVYPHALLGGFSWIARPIMAGLTLLAGVPGSMPFFTSVERAAAWINAGYLRGDRAAEASIVQAVAELRAIAAKPEVPGRAQSI